MVVFREEGDRSLRFLDAWSEVEAKHAIEAGHMANAIKKSAAAAKVAGFDFDQLNGIVAAIGSTTRQSGNEIGTSMRFISRRLFTEDGPKALAKLPKSVSTISPTGENRSGFDILSDLAGQWKDLTEAQKLNVATSIGGTRQYNSLLVMMDQWDEVLRGVNNSMNSKGSSERRNAEMMKTYAKQLEQTKAAATELKVELGGIVLPTFKAGLSGFKNLLEAVSAIPVPIKIAATAMTLLIGALGKGLPIIDGIAESMSKGKALFSNFGDALSSQMKIGKFELTGKGKSDSNVSLDLLKTVTTKDGLARGTNLSDFHSAAGKTMFLLKEAALVYNRIIAQLPIIFGAGLEKAGEGTKSVGKFMSFSGGLFDSDKKKSSSDVIGGLRTASEAKGLGPDAIKAAFKGGPKALGKLGMKAAGFATEIAGIATTIVGEVIDTSGEYLGSAGHGMLKEFTNSNAGLTKTMAPMLVTIAALAPAIKVAYSEFSKLNQSAQDFEDSMNGAMSANSDNLKNVRDTINKYNTIDSKLNDAQKASSPETKQRRMELGTYVAPIVTLQKTYGEIMDMTNSLAEENINLVVGYDKLGNAVLRTTDNFKTYFKELEKAKVKEGLSTDIEVMAKYVTDLTKTDGAEKFKVVMKDLAESFPVIGELISRNIKVSPAKALELATDDLNKRVNMKQKYPLSTAADEDIKRLQNVVKSARNAFKETYVGFETAYKKAVAPTNFKNFGKDEIESLLSSPEMMKAYELKLNVDPKFKIVKNVKPEDILGREVLAALNPDLAGVLDYNSRLTTANIETAGIHSRLDSKSDILKLHNNDIITLSKYKRDGLFAPNMNTESIANNLDAAGNQAIVKMKKNIDGQFEWVAEYFNTKTLKIESRPIEDIESYVENIFPANKIKEDLSYRLDSLNTFVAGASAGLVGISPKDFKRDFNMGEKFFSEIPTSTLLQGDFGFEPGKGFGKVDSMSNYRKDIEDFYFKPMEELKTKMEVFDKARLEGMDKDDFTMSKESYDEIEKLLTILKNKQVILQFRSVFVELMKEFSEGERILKQNLAVAKNRFDYEKETGGLLKGVSKSAANYQLSGYKTSELTPMQSLVKRDSSAAKSIADIERMEMIVGSKLSQIDSISKAKVNLNEIRSIAKATGASIDEKNIGSYVEKVAASMDESGPYKELNKSSTMIADNTKETVERLDALLENQGNPEAIKEMMSSILDKALFANKGEETAAAMERVAGIRSRAESKGNQEIVIETNKALDALTKKLIDQVGYEKGAELVSKGRKGSVLSPFMNFSSDFKEEEFRQRALGGMDPKVFMDKLDRYVPVPQKRDINSKWGSEGLEFFSWSKEPTGFKGSDEYKDITELQRKQNKKPLIDANTIAKTEAAMVAFSYMEKLGKERVSSRFDERIVDLDNQIKEAKALGKTEAFIRPLAVKQEALISEKGKVDKEAEFYGTVQALSSIGLAASEMAIAFGLTEKQVKALNVAAIGTYLAMKAASKATGEEIPRSAKEFEATFNKVIAGMMSTGEAPSRSDLKDLRDKGGILQEEVDKHNKNVFGKSGTDLNKYLENQKKEEEKLKTLKDDKSIKEAYKTQTKSAAAINAELDAYRNSSEEAKKYDEMFRRQQKERQALSNKQGGYKPETDEYKDMDVKHKAEQFEWARNISKEEAQRLKDSYPKTNPLSGDYSKKLQENYTSEMQNYGEKARRGAEKDVGTNRFSQALLTYTAVAATDYANKKGKERVELSTLESKMEAQQQAMLKAMEKYPEATAKVLEEVYSKQSSTTNADGTEVPMVDKALAKSTDEGYNEVVSAINKYNEELVKSLKELSEQLAKQKADLFDKLDREEYSRNNKAMGIAELERNASNVFGRDYSLKNVLQGKNSSQQQKPTTWKDIMTSFTAGYLGGYIGEKLLNSVNRKSTTERYSYAGDVELPTTKQDMSAQQRLFTESSSDFRNVFNAYADGGNVLNTMKSNMDGIYKKINEKTQLVNESKDADTVKHAKQAIKDLTVDLENQTEAADKYANKLREFALVYAPLEKFSSVIYQLRNNLRDMDLQNFTNSIKGVMEYKSNIDMLLGGSHPDAAQMVSTEDERAASRVGIKLKNMESTSYDIEKARLLSGLSKASGQEAVNIRQQLADLPEKRRRDLAAMEQKRYDEDLKRSTSVYNDQLYSLEKVKNMEGLDPDLRDSINEYQEAIAEANRRASEKVSIEDYKKEYDKNKSKVYDTDDKDLINLYKFEGKQLEKYSQAGYEQLYRNIPSWTRADIAYKEPNSMIDLMKESTVESGEGLLLQANVTDKIVEAIHETNTILKAIGKEGFGIDDKEGYGVKSEDSSWFRKMFSTPTPESYLSVAAYKKWFSEENKASGGYISGPGTKTSDSIPAMLSNGEFVIKASSVEKLGIPNLNYLNTYGKIPGFADGGVVDTGMFGWLNRKSSEGLDYLKDKRLSLAKTNVDITDSMEGRGILGKLIGAGKFTSNVLSMGALAAGEISGKLLKSPIDMLSGIEGASSYMAKNGFSGAKRDMSSVIDVIKENGLFNVAKGVGQGIYSSMMEDLSTGGTGITSGIIGSLAGAGLSKGSGVQKVSSSLSRRRADYFPNKVGKSLSRRRKSYDSPNPEFNSISDVRNYWSKLAEENEVMKGIRFEFPSAVEDDNTVGNLKAIVDELNSYTKDAPEAPMLYSILTGDTAKRMATTKGSPYRSGAVKGMYYKGHTALNLKDRTPDEMVETFRHEVMGHHFDIESLILKDAIKNNVFGKIDAPMSSFVKRRGKVDDLIKGVIESGDINDYPTPYAFRSTIRKGNNTGALETFAEAASRGYKKDLPINSAVKGFRDLTIKNDLIKELMSSAYKNEDFMKFRANSIANQSHLLRFADGGLVSGWKDPLKRGGAVWAVGKNKLRSVEELLAGDEQLSSGDATWTTSDGVKHYLKELIKDKDVSVSGGNKNLSSLWAIDTMNKANLTMREAGQGRGRVDISKLPEDLRDHASEGFMGINAQYDTDDYRKGLRSKRNFFNQSMGREARLLRASDSGRADAARRAYTNPELAKSLGVKHVMADRSRQLVRLDNDPIAYQSLTDMKEKDMNFSYSPYTNMASKSYSDRLKSDAESYKAYTTERTNKRPSFFMDRIEENIEMSKKALSKSDISEAERTALSQTIDRSNALLKVFDEGADPFSSEFQMGTVLALSGMTLKKGDPMNLTSKVSGENYTNLWKNILFRNRPGNKLEPTTNKDVTGSIGEKPSDILAKNEIKDTIAKAISGDPSRVTKDNPFAISGKSTIETIMELLTNNKSKEAFWQDDYWSGFSQGGLAKPKERYMMEKLNKVLNRSAEVMHNGGIVHSDGLVFAQQGEMFIPKKFASGGLVNSESTNSVALGSASFKIDASDILDKLESIELKVEDKELKVENRTLKVEDKVLKIEDRKVSVDIPDMVEVKKPDWKIEVDKTTLPKVVVDKPDWKVQVEVPREQIKLSVDVSEAATRLKDAISSALDRNIKVSINNPNNSVGSDKLDQVAAAVSKVNDRIIAVKNEIEGKIKIVGGNNETLDIDRKVATAVENKIMEFNRDLNDIRNSVGNALSNQRQKEVYYQSKIDDIDYKLRNIMNVTGSGRGI